MKKEGFPKVKICGLSRVSDIEAVNAAKPDYVGFVFAESRRKVTPRQAADLRKRLLAGIIPVGVFVNETIDNIIPLVRAGVIEVIQLHGSETEEYIAKIKSLSGRLVIKAVSVTKEGDAQKRGDTCADYLLLDGKMGGSGKNFDWNLIGVIQKPFFLAGGLNIENVKRAIGKVNPFAVDISSGVETDGVKDGEKIKLIVGRVRYG